MRKIRIGITINVKEPTESLFSNGIKQNAIIIRDTFAQIKEVQDVYYINLGKQKDYSLSPWKKYEQFIINFDESLEKVDVIVCVCASLPTEYAKLAKNKGIKIVHHIMGNEFYAFTESVLFKNEQNTIIERDMPYDAVWISPHLYENNKDLFEVLYDCEAHVGAYVWSPEFLTAHVDSQKEKSGKDKYIPAANKQKRVGVFEPNLSFVKTSIIPILAGEKMFRQYPEYLDSLNLFGAASIKDKKVLINFVKNLEIQKNKKIFFEDRYPIVWALFNHTDIILSHQQHCNLNYLYLDAAWLGYPVVHNSEAIKDIGFYYSGYDAGMAAERLYDVAKTFDSNYGQYLEKSRKAMSRFFPTDSKNVKSYKKLLEKLFK
jgi:hypothetical protein